MVAYCIIGYLLVGAGSMAWFLTEIIRDKQPVDNGDGTTTERRVITLMYLPPLIGFLIFLLELWPIAMVLYILSKAAPAENEENPQDRVPPEYR